MISQGWLPPPRPIYVAPSYDPSDSDEMTRWKILFDWAHDDDLKNYITSQKTLLWEFGGSQAVNGHYNALPTDTLIGFYFMGPNPTADQILEFAIKYDAFVDLPPDPGDAGQPVSIPGEDYIKTVPTVLPAVWNTIWHGIDDVITNKVIPKRATLGPLPENTFLNDTGTDLADPVIINYYDDIWIKRIKYPRMTLQTASTQPIWWNVGSGVNTPKMEQWATNGTDVWGNHAPASSSDTDADWYDDGWDFAKGSGAFFDVVHAAVGVLMAVLSLTGIGAVVATFIGAVLTIVTDLIQAAEISLQGGNPATALLNIGDAILSVGTAEIGGLAKASPALGKLGKAGIGQLGQLLKQVGTDLSPPHQTLSLENELAILDANAAKYNVMTLDNFNAILSIVSGNGSVGVPLAQAGWDMSQYATRSDVIGVGMIYMDYFPGPAAALWKMGAHLGTLAKQQAAMGIQQLSPWARAPSVRIVPIAAVISPQADLMNYVRFTLAPHYNIPT